MKKVISILVVLVGFLGFSQQKITEHIVSPNEKISKITIKQKNRHFNSKFKKRC